MDIIVNVSEDWGIGCKGKLLYSIPEDLARFKSLTLGRAVVLGRLTLETFPGGRPLKGRTNIMLSTQGQTEGAVTVPSLECLFKEIVEHGSQNVSVIGGESVYRTLLPYCEKAYITKTYGNIAADRFFPNLDALENWRQTDFSPLYCHGGLDYRYITYVNAAPVPLPV